MQLRGLGTAGAAKIRILQIGEHFLRRNIFQQDGLVRIQQVQGRDGPHRIEQVRPDGVVRIITGQPLGRIGRRIVPPRFQVLVDIDIDHGQRAAADQIRHPRAGFQIIDDGLAGLAARITEKEQGIRRLDAVQVPAAPPQVREPEIGCLRPGAVEPADAGIIGIRLAHARPDQVRTRQAGNEGQISIFAADRGIRIEEVFFGEFDEGLKKIGSGIPPLDRRRPVIHPDHRGFYRRRHNLAEQGGE